MLMKTVRTNFDRDETRRDRRYLLPVVVTLDGVEYAAANWSLGGFLIEGSLFAANRFEGTLTIPAQGASFDFTAEVVRRSPEGTGFRFIERSPELFGALDRLIGQRLAGRKASP
jgi:hypothetical protein